MLKAYKYKLKPSKVQEEQFAQAFGCARFLYNQLLNWWQNEYALAKSEERQMDKLPLVTFFKQQYPFLKDVDSLVLMNARRNFDIALKNFFSSKKGSRKGKRSGFPTFKKKGVNKDSFTTNNQNGTVRIFGNKVKLPKIGYVNFIKHRDLPNDYKILSATISKSCSNHYYISLCIETNDKNVKQKDWITNPLVVGLDMSMSQFVVDSDSSELHMKTKYVRQYRKNEKKLARLQRELSRKQKSSHNREKSRLEVAKLHEHISNCRKDFAIKQAIHYATSYDVVVIEDINLQGMQQSLHLGKSVSDLGFGIFKQWLEYKCQENGTLLVKADKWFASSKLCNHCGSKNTMLKLSDREWVCPNCGTILDRDFNAACNLRDWYINQTYNTVGATEINACGDMTSTSISVDASCVVEARNQQI